MESLQTHHTLNQWWVLKKQLWGNCSEMSNVTHLIGTLIDTQTYHLDLVFLSTRIAIILLSTRWQHIIEISPVVTWATISYGWNVHY